MSQNFDIQAIQKSCQRPASGRHVPQILAQDVKPFHLSQPQAFNCDLDNLYNVKHLNECKKNNFPEQFAIQYRSCPLCGTSLDGVSKYAACPKCHYKGPIDDCYDSVDYQDDITADDILRNFNRYRYSGSTCRNAKSGSPHMDANNIAGIETKACGCINIPRLTKDPNYKPPGCLCDQLGKSPKHKPRNRFFEILRAVYDPNNIRTRYKDAQARSIRLYENRYPGIVMGHKNCRDHHKGVPEYMGWLWNVRAEGTKKYRRGWQPGAVAIPVAQIMHHFLSQRAAAWRSMENNCETRCINERITKPQCRCSKSKCSKKKMKRRLAKKRAQSDSSGSGYVFNCNPGMNGEGSTACHMTSMKNISCDHFKCKLINSNTALH